MREKSYFKENSIRKKAVPKKIYLALYLLDVNFCWETS